MEETIEELKRLFEEANVINEFDFVQSLINYRGLGTHKLVTNLYEWFDSMENYVKLYNIQIELKNKVRLGLLIYSTFQENSDFYNIIGSLCNVILGLKPSSYLYWKTKKYERVLGVSEKQGFLLEKLYDSNYPYIIEFFKNNIHTSIRNNFFHSTYSLSNQDFILHETEPVILDGKSYYSLEIETQLFPLIENVIQFFQTFRNEFFKHFESYKVDKEVIGYFPTKCNVTIIGSEQGLQGFKIKNSVQFYGKFHDSGIWYNSETDMFEGHNIVFNSPSIEQIELHEQLNRYNGKDDIHQNDSEFHNAVERVIERSIPDELQFAVQLLLKFGDIRFKKMEAEENPFKKKSFSKFILPFYEKAILIAKGKTDTSELEMKIVQVNQL
jgi:hypothetical protein